MEALSDIIQLFRMNVSVFHNAQSCGDFNMEASHLGNTVFHMVTKGDCHLEVPGEVDTILKKGDVVIFPRELPHSMKPVTESFGIQAFIPLDQAKGIPGTGIICAQASFSHDGSLHILDALPKVFIVRYDSKNRWSSNIIQLIVDESENPNIASASILDRLCELLFIYALRNHLSQTSSDANILSLYADKRLQKAIHAIHTNPGREWTLETLAYEASMSRTSFAEAFRTVSGWTVAKYITWWRMQIAWAKLSEGESSAVVAESIGYKSEAAFSRAFKNAFGVPAGKVRRGEV